MATLDLSHTALLNEMLKESGVLGPQDNMVVESLVTEAHDNSTFYHVKVQSSGVSINPLHLVLKSNHAEGAEARFYSRLLPVSPQLPVVPCFGARHDAISLQNQVLLADHSESLRRERWYKDRGISRHPVWMYLLFSMLAPSDPRT